MILQIKGQQSDSYSISKYESKDLRKYELNPQNLKNLPTEERREVLQAFNISMFNMSYVIANNEPVHDESPGNKSNAP